MAGIGWTVTGELISLGLRGRSLYAAQSFASDLQRNNRRHSWVCMAQFLIRLMCTIVLKRLRYTFRHAGSRLCT